MKKGIGIYVAIKFASVSTARILEPIFIGCAANVIVNLLFGQGRLRWDISEFVVACILAIPVTEMNRLIDRRLAWKISWADQPGRRLLTHFCLVTVGLMITLNILGNLYMFVSGSGFFTFAQLIVINFVVLVLAAALTVTKWSVYFYSLWIGAEGKAELSAKRADVLMAKISKPTSVIGVQKGLTKMKIGIDSIRIAKVESGTVRLYASDGDGGVFQGSLTELSLQLPEYLFFRASRDVIVHRDVIRKTTSSSFGKILLTVSRARTEEFVMVSRPKAAAFRRWYNSNSA
ncbi:MAG TPA: LytTR family DNA-binding domain-containing protein [Cyclobacteriaceae bacterium]|nr:LytTR family DNA-binding domain-containing protein [Cyclobacteriaceae bacterium]